jgi:hypothetical protein
MEMFVNKALGRTVGPKRDDIRAVLRGLLKGSSFTTTGFSDSVHRPVF